MYRMNIYVCPDEHRSEYSEGGWGDQSTGIIAFPEKLPCNVIIDPISQERCTKTAVLTEIGATTGD